MEEIKTNIVYMAGRGNGKTITSLDNLLKEVGKMFKVKDTYISLENILKIEYLECHGLSERNYLTITYDITKTKIHIEMFNFEEYKTWADLIMAEVNGRKNERS